jgi:redox-sensing transcriptional repressor
MDTPANKDISREFIPEPVLRRLPWYLAYVTLLQQRGIEYVSSTNISKELSVDASQIAKDLSFLNIKGKTRIGYEVTTLCQKLQDLLGFKRRHNAVVLGVGSLGGSLIHDTGLNNYGLNIVAGFDINPAIIGKRVREVPIYNVNELQQRCHEVNAEVGIVTLPVDHAQEGADALIAAGVKAIWNFTPSRIRTPQGIVVTNTSIYAHLAVMYNRLESLNQSEL